MDYIYFFIYSHYILFTIVCIFSTRKALLLFWASLFYIPSIILSTVSIKSYITLITLQIITLGFIKFSYFKSEILGFYKTHQKAIISYIIYTISIILLSETVPWNKQLYFVFNETLFLFILAITFFYSRKDNTFIYQLAKIIGILVILNGIYCAIFEIYAGINPAGVPLYILMGNDELGDMSNIERGLFSFRLQSIYGHPLSLGQYFLLLAPIFYIRRITSSFIKYGTSFIILCLVILSGTRGAIFPLIFIILVLFSYNIITKTKFLLNTILISILIIFFYIYFVPIKYQKIISPQIENITTSLQFWNDKLQRKKNVTGSSMKMRINQFKAAQIEITNNICFGKGKGYREFYQNKYHTLHPKLLGYESLLILKLVEEGYIGLLFYLMMICYLYIFFKRKTCNVRLLFLLYFAYILSTVMTGIRPHSLLILGLTSIIIVSASPKKNTYRTQKYISK